MIPLESTARFLQIDFCTSKSAERGQKAEKPHDRGTTACSVSQKYQNSALVFEVVTLYLLSFEQEL